MLVSQLMDLCCPTVPPDASPAQIAATMRGENSGMVTVCDAQKHVLGVITDRDMILRVFCAQNPCSGYFEPSGGTPASGNSPRGHASSAEAAKSSNIDVAPGAEASSMAAAPCMTASPALTASSVMTAPVVTAAPGDDIHDAALLMSRNGICRLPVVENERLVGLLTLRSLARQRLYIAEIGHIVYNKARRD